MTKFEESSMADRSCLIDGRWQPAAQGEWLEMTDPADGAVICRIARGTDDDIDAAVKAARRAQPLFARRPPVERVRLLNAIARRIQAEAEDAVRSGCEHVMLTDRNVNEDRVPLPMILATGAVHSHLVKQQLRTFASVNVASGECLDVHHFAVLIGVGATTVNAYVAESAIADRHARGLLPGLELG